MTFFSFGRHSQPVREDTYWVLHVSGPEGGKENGKVGVAWEAKIYRTKVLSSQDDSLLPAVN